MCLSCSYTTCQSLKLPWETMESSSSARRVLLRSRRIQRGSSASGVWAVPDSVFPAAAEHASALRTASVGAAA